MITQHDEIMGHAQRIRRRQIRVNAFWFLVWAVLSALVVWNEYFR